ncbi:MAG: hypothetical protein D6732_04480 [Methanobacteriota archaeon]|nr:MAG: hypothetical protein D6732_04480 [Euryarchaeota archaeon]
MITVIIQVNLVAKVFSSKSLLFSLAIGFVGFLSITLAPGEAMGTRNGGWMKGSWGVRVVLPACNTSDVYKFSPTKLVGQLKKLRTAKWVMVNATWGGYGGCFSESISPLLRQIHPYMEPHRDLLDETINLLRANGFKVVVYFAAEGGVGLKLETMRNKRRRDIRLEIRNRWNDFVSSSGLTNSQAVARFILDPLAKKLGHRVDGWWFDHGRHSDPNDLIPVVKKWNPKALVAWNEGHEGIKCGNRVIWGLRRSTFLEDYTAGHITDPTGPRGIPPWHPCNELIIDQIEMQTKGFQKNGLIPHVLIPMQRFWRRGKGFPVNRLKTWTWRIIKAGGAVTWSVMLVNPEFKYSKIPEDQLNRLIELDHYLELKGVRPR